MKLVISLFLVFSLAVPASALEITAPEIPESGEAYMPENTESFGDGLLKILRSAVNLLQPNLSEASKVSLTVISAVMILSILSSFTGSIRELTEFAGSIVIGTILLLNTNAMIQLGAQTVQEMSDYVKLLYPVMTAAMAAQGGVTASAALYTGTAVFDAVLSGLISKVLLPMVYLFLALAVANNAVGEDILKKMCDAAKNFTSWSLKTILIIFTTYMSITGVVSGTTDAAALKAAKVTISSVVPVVGSILSDASEAVLVSAGVLKNAAGIYGIFAILAVYLEPFVCIGSHYLLLKATAAICSILGSKRITELIDEFSTAMGLLLAMTGSVCLLLLISTVCFMKGVG